METASCHATLWFSAVGRGCGAEMAGTCPQATCQVRPLQDGSTLACRVYSLTAGPHLLDSPQSCHQAALRPLLNGCADTTLTKIVQAHLPRRQLLSGLFSSGHAAAALDLALPAHQMCTQAAPRPRTCGTAVPSSSQRCLAMATFKPCSSAETVSWLLQVFPALDPSTKIYAAGFTMELIRRRLQEFNLYDADRCRVFNMGERFRLGPFE